MKLKLNEITSSLTQDDIIKNMVSRHQGFEVKGNQDALNYTIASREHAVKAIESELMVTATQGRETIRENLIVKSQANAGGYPVLISTPFYFSFKKAPSFTSIFADESKLYLRAQLYMYASRAKFVYVAQWSPHQFLLEKVTYDPDFVDILALPYIHSLWERYEKEKDTPLFIVIDTKEAIETVELIEEYKVNIEILQGLLKGHMEELETLANGHNLKIGKHEFRFIERKGSIDYAKYAKDNGLDLEEYRKPSGGSWRLFDAK